MTIRNTELIEKAYDSRNQPLTRQEVDVLWDQASSTMHAGSYQEAFATVEALLCQADREGGLRSPDLLPDPLRTKVGEGRTGVHLEILVRRLCRRNVSS